MLTKPKHVLIGFGIAVGLTLGGCSGDDPAATPTASATPQASASASPDAAPEASATPAATSAPTTGNTPDPNYSPLGGKPATEEEKEYYRLQKKAEDFVLSRNYEKAIPLLEQALQQRPEDPENSFYLLLSHGSLEVVPSKGSAAYPYAKKVVELAPKSNEAGRARAYLVGAEFSIPKDFKYGNKTFYTYGGVYPRTRDRLQVGRRRSSPRRPERAPEQRRQGSALGGRDCTPDVERHRGLKERRRSSDTI